MKEEKEIRENKNEVITFQSIARDIVYSDDYNDKEKLVKLISIQLELSYKDGFEANDDGFFNQGE